MLRSSSALFWYLSVYPKVYKWCWIAIEDARCFKGQATTGIVSSNCEATMRIQTSTTFPSNVCQAAYTVYLFSGTNSLAAVLVSVRVLDLCVKHHSLVLTVSIGRRKPVSGWNG